MNRSVISDFESEHQIGLLHHLLIQMRDKPISTDSIAAQILRSDHQAIQTLRAIIQPYQPAIAGDSTDLNPSIKP